MSLSTNIADSVVGELNSGSFSQTFTARRVAIPRTDLEELSELKVSVIPRSVVMTTQSRAITKYVVSIDVGIQKKMTDPETEVALLGELVDEIAEFLHRRKLAGSPYAQWIGIRNEPIYAVEHILKNRTFTSVLTVDYMLLK